MKQSSLRRLLLVAAVASFVTAPVYAQTANATGPEFDEAINDAVRNGDFPGAVLLVGHQGKVVYRKAYGSRVLIPTSQPMQTDTIFDAASLTKVIATTSCLMKLFEQGKLRIDDPVTRYLPGFQGGKSDITVRNLMTHFSGLRPDLDLRPVWSGYETGIQRALIDKPVDPPGTKFVYSDINFILLGEIVRVLSGEPLSLFAKHQIFEPLGMKDTTFQPSMTLRPRIAATEIDEFSGEPLWGVVHDETARDMGGVAGHAGLFTTADDLSIFAQMMINRGTVVNPQTKATVKLFNPLTIRKFTEPGSPADQPILRGLGWDIDSAFSSNRGELFPLGSFGHTGFTGTSIWMDPSTKGYVLLLTNIVHPKRGRPLTSLRARIATMAAKSFHEDVAGVTLTGYNETIIGAGIHRPVARNANVLTGLDVLEQQKFKPLRGKRVGLITNHTGLDKGGKRNIDLMLAAGVRVTALFSPEHGIAGQVDSEVGNSTDPASHLPVVSLYQPNQRRLTAAQMKNLDAVVYDIQDVGARFYTYSCTMLYALEEAAKAKKTFYLLDRPNPITGTHMEGPMLDDDQRSFTGCYNIPLRHGLTFGELATLANNEQHWGANLKVVKMIGWQRGDWFDTTSLLWVNPSPNMRSLNAALLYPGLAMLEAAKNYSVGRGTDAPFEQIGADWIRGIELTQELNSRVIAGIRVYPTRFKPTSSNFAGKEVEGIRLVVTNREAFNSTSFGLELAAALQKLYPNRIDFAVNKGLIGKRAVIERLKNGDEARLIESDAQSDLVNFQERRKPALLY